MVSCLKKDNQSDTESVEYSNKISNEIEYENLYSELSIGYGYGNFNENYKIENGGGALETYHDRTHIQNVLDALESMKYEKTSDIITSFEYFSIVLRGDNIESLIVFIVYDYYLKQEYIFTE